MSLTVGASTTAELMTRVHELQLDRSRYWHLLLHAPENESQVDDLGFFLASKGKYDPSAELEATVQHLNEDENRTNGSVYCRFPARRTWLEHELNYSFTKGKCSDYDALVEKLDPRKVTLVFPSAHINSPASMFGHTFLRIDSSMNSTMTSYAVNYAAQTGDTNGVLFAYKGIFGGYPGYFSMLPYYEKLKEYRDSESRDLWEYDLNLTRDEVMAMVRHIWEMQNIYSDYYFFNENCSSNMLWLAEIARPGVHLQEHFGYYVIPPETIRAFEEENMVDKRHFRPSKRTRLKAYERYMDAAEVQMALALSNGMEEEAAIEHFSLADQRYILEAAAELIEYDYIAGSVDKETYRKRYHALLSRRAGLGKGDAIEIPEKNNPDTAHYAGRFQVAKGWSDTRNPWILGWRPAYHDLGEDDTGHLGGAQIEFLDAAIGIEHSTLSLEKLTLLSLASITPISPFFQPFSWRMKAGWDRDYGHDASSFVMRVGAGASIGDEYRYAYVMAEPELRMGFECDTGIGLSVGAVINGPGRIKSRFEYGAVAYAQGENRTHADLSLLWQQSRYGALYVRYGNHCQNGCEDRVESGINLYF